MQFPPTLRAQSCHLYDWSWKAGWSELDLVLVYLHSRIRNCCSLEPGTTASQYLPVESRLILVRIANAHQVVASCEHNMPCHKNVSGC